MTNTLENKARFFALYWGQIVLRDNFWFPQNIRIIGNDKFHLFQDASSKIGGISEKHIYLTPLSQISDEDARFVIDIYDKMCNKPIYQSQTKVGAFGEVFKQIFWTYPTSCPNDDGYRVAANFSDDIVNVIDSPNRFEMHIQCIDYLRSRGYALPWMGISVEQQIEWGWVKLKG